MARVTDKQSTDATSAIGDESLTPRERQVAELIAGGFANREIAAQLVIAERTAERHVENILGRLGLRSRTQIAVWAVQHRMVGLS